MYICITHSQQAYILHLKMFWNSFALSLIWNLLFLWYGISSSVWIFLDITVSSLKGTMHLLQCLSISLAHNIKQLMMVWYKKVLMYSRFTHFTPSTEIQDKFCRSSWFSFEWVWFWLRVPFVYNNTLNTKLTQHYHRKNNALVSVSIQSNQI